MTLTILMTLVEIVFALSVVVPIGEPERLPLLDRQIIIRYAITQMLLG